MKVLFDHPLPFLLAHGGFQHQIEQTKAALAANGVEVEWLRWWDTTQSGQLIHYFGRPGGVYIDLAHQKGLKVVMGELLGGLGVRPPLLRAAQKLLMRLSQTLLPGGFTVRMAWQAHRTADALVNLTPWEAQLSREMFNAPRERSVVVPNGVEEVFFQSQPQPRGPWLVCTATITECKRVVELARAAVAAETPLWVLGRPFGESDPYYLEFSAVAKAQPKLIRYEGALGDRAALARVYRQARGFVLLSEYETLSISALEAAACECPLLLSDLPWAHSVFGDRVRYCPVTRNPAETARRLRDFYEKAPGLPKPPRPASWLEVGRQLKTVYERVLSNSR